MALRTACSGLINTRSHTHKAKTKELRGVEEEVIGVAVVEGVRMTATPTARIKVKLMGSYYWSLIGEMTGCSPLPVLRVLRVRIQNSF